MVDSPEELAPCLLVAMPQLLDPNFRRSVVLLAAHGDEGAMGFVVNRVLPATVDDVLQGLEIPWAGAVSAPVFGGGPVMPQGGWVLYDSPEGGLSDDCQQVLPSVYLSASVAVLRKLAARPPDDFRLLLGYAGWGPRQLEGELVEGSWLVVPPTRSLVFDTTPENMWDSAIRTLGIEPSALVPGHGVQ